VFLFTEPLGNWRCVDITESRTRVDWALQIKNLVDVCYPQATKIRLVMDNLNTHTIGSLYETFPAEEARRIAEKLEIHYTPKHGSWLNVAEIELRVLTVQCDVLPAQLPGQHQQRASAPAKNPPNLCAYPARRWPPTATRATTCSGGIEAGGDDTRRQIRLNSAVA
jgi:hypothetical protein